MTPYSKRVWLNQEGSSSSGTAVAYHGQRSWREEPNGEFGQSTFFEVSDCHCKARLHKTDADTMQDFINKLRTLANMADDFADFLEGEK